MSRDQAAINIYTDASVRQDGKSACACFVEGVHRNPCGRLPDHTPITLAEIHAILAWREAQDRHEDTIMHSDSMAAIKILAQTKHEHVQKSQTNNTKSRHSQIKYLVH